MKTIPVEWSGNHIRFYYFWTAESLSLFHDHNNNNTVLSMSISLSNPFILSQESKLHEKCSSLSPLNRITQSCLDVHSYLLLAAILLPFLSLPISPFNHFLSRFLWWTENGRRWLLVDAVGFVHTFAYSTASLSSHSFIVQPYFLLS